MERLDGAAWPSQNERQIRVVARNGVIVVDDLRQAGECSIMHERAVQLSARINEVAQVGRGCNAQVCATADRGDDTVVPCGSVREARLEMAPGTVRSASRIRANEELQSPVLAVRKALKLPRKAAAPHDCGVVLRIERLDTADKLAERFLDSQLVDSGRTERGVKENLVFGQSREFRKEVIKIRVAIRSAKTHFNRASNGLGHQLFEDRHAPVPKEIEVMEADINKAHRVARCHTAYPGAGRGRITEGMGLLVTGAATDGVIARQTLVVKEDAAKCRADIRHYIWGIRWRHRSGYDGRVILGDIKWPGLVRIVRQCCEIDYALFRMKERS